MGKNELVIRLLKEKVRLLRELKELNKLQPEYIKFDRFLKLDKNIQKGNEIISFIISIDGELSQIQNENYNKDFATELLEFDDEFKKLADEIININHKNKCYSEDKIVRIKNIIKEVNQSKKSLIAYSGNDMDVSGAHLDTSR